MEVFKWCPLIGLNVEYEQAIKEVQFGDGYEQVSEDGLNSMRQVFESAVFTGHEDGEIKDIFNFFMRHKFTKAFKLEVAGYSAIVRFAQPFKKKEKGGRIVELSLSMKEVFR